MRERWWAANPRIGQADLCDGAIGYAVHSTLAMGTGYATLELSRLPRLVFAGPAQIRCAA